jgi:hypothetical protein
VSWLTPLLRLSAGFPHPLVTIVAAMAIAICAALLGQGRWRARVNYAAYLSVCSVLSVIAGSWAMYFIHR